MPSDYRRNGGTQMASFSVFEEIAAILSGSSDVSESARHHSANVGETGNLACRTVMQRQASTKRETGRWKPDLRIWPVTAARDPMPQQEESERRVVGERKTPGGPAPTTLETAMNLVNYALPVRIERVRVYRFH